MQAFFWISVAQLGPEPESSTFPLEVRVRTNGSRGQWVQTSHCTAELLNRRCHAMSFVAPPVWSETVFSNPQPNPQNAMSYPGFPFWLRRPRWHTPHQLARNHNLVVETPGAPFRSRRCSFEMEPTSTATRLIFSTSVSSLGIWCTCVDTMRPSRSSARRSEPNQTSRRRISVSGVPSTKSKCIRRLWQNHRSS